MLVNHPDAECDGFMRRCKGVRLSVDNDFAGVRFVKAIRDAHSRGFAGSVFSNDAVDRAGTHSNVDAIVGKNVGESLADVSEFEHRRSYFSIALVTLICPEMILRFASSSAWIVAGESRS